MWLLTSNLGEGEGFRGQGWFERALVSSYRPFVVTFPLSLCVSEILPLLFSSTLVFPCPTSSCPQNFPMFYLGVGGSPFATKSESVGLIVQCPCN